MDKLWNDVLDHWERLLLNPATDRPDSRFCAFCKEYRGLSHNFGNGWCVRCLVMEHTGKVGCTQTPYELARYTHSLMEQFGVHISYDPHIYAEYKFLVGVYRHEGRNTDIQDNTD